MDEEIKTVSRFYVSRMLREDRAILLGWITDGSGYHVHLRIRHSDRIIKAVYKVFPTYLAKTYQDKYPDFINGGIKT